MSEFGQITNIFEWVFSPIDSIATEAASAIYRILNNQTSLKNNILYNSLKYIHLKKSEIAKFDKFKPELRESLLCVATLNGNGFVREEALSKLSKNKTNFSFPFILFRLSDWATEVRVLAEEIIRKMIASSETEFLIRHHKTIDWLLKVQRNDLSELHSEITNGIFSPNNITQILSTVDTYSEGDRFYIYKNLISRNLLTQANLESALNDKNYLIRLLGTKAINLSKTPKILKRLLIDKSQIIRSYALKKIDENQITIFKAELTNLLVDDSGSIRERSRNLLSKVEKIDFYQFYKDSFNQKPTVGNTLGISEVGTEDDVFRFKELLNSSKSKLRAASLFAISNLDLSIAKEMCFDMLFDESNKVRETCASIITKTVLPNDLEKLRNIYDKGDTDTKRYTLRIIKNYGGWSIAGDFLKGLSESDKRLRDLSYTLLSGWHNYSIRLGTELKDSNREYVLGVYRKINLENLPHGSRAIAERIPFIFGEK